MKPSHLFFSLAAVVTAFVSFAEKVAPDLELPTRYVDHNLLISEALPVINIKVAEEFTYLGRFDIEIIASSDEYKKDLLGKPIAAGERFVFAVADAEKNIEKMFIVQFEGWLPGTEGIYNYRFNDDHIMAGRPFRHNTWFYDARASARLNPKGEGARTDAFLQQQGYHLADELMMSRFLALASEDRKNEIIIYYFEMLGDTTGMTLKEWEQQSGTAKTQMIRSAFIERSEQSFHILESK